MKTSEILRKAKKYLWNGTSKTVSREALCLALWDAACLSTPADRARIGKVMNRISRALHKQSYVHGWLVAKGHATYAQINNPKLIQAYRHRWLNALIAEYERKGD